MGRHIPLFTPVLSVAALTVVVMSALPALAARAAECRLPGLQASVRLNESFGDIHYSNGYSGKQLEAKRQRAGARGGPGPEWHPVGLMGRDLKWEFRVQVQGQRLGGGYCVGLAQAEMTVGYDRINVYVDRRYRPGTCQYQVILEHENQHVRNFKDTLTSYLPVIRRQLAAEAAVMPPVPAGSMNAGAKYFVGMLRDRMTPLIERMQADMAEADRRLDTASSYRATQARCDGW